MAGILGKPIDAVMVNGRSYAVANSNVSSGEVQEVQKDAHSV